MRWIEEGGGILTLIRGDIEDLEEDISHHSLTKKLYSTQYSRVYTMKL